MKKFVFSALMMLFGLGLYAQQAPTAAVSQKPAAVKTPDTPQQEAQKLVDMLTQDKTYSETQKKSIFDVALTAVKERKAIASLRTSNPSAFAQKEMDIFVKMTEKIKDIESQK